MKPWQEKANRLIAAMCEASRKQARGKRKKHVPYSVPADAEFLIDCLNHNDEDGAKGLFQSRAIFEIPDHVSYQNCVLPRSDAHA